MGAGQSGGNLRICSAALMYSAKGRSFTSTRLSLRRTWMEMQGRGGSPNGSSAVAMPSSFLQGAGSGHISSQGRGWGRDLGRGGEGSAEGFVRHSDGIACFKHSHTRYVETPMVGISVAEVRTCCPDPNKKQKHNILPIPLIFKSLFVTVSG